MLGQGHELVHGISDGDVGGAKNPILKPQQSKNALFNSPFLRPFSAPKKFPQRVNLQQSRKVKVLSEILLTAFGYFYKHQMVIVSSYAFENK